MAKKVDALETQEVTAEPIVVTEKLVKVKSKITGQKFIAGDWYNLVANKEIEVPQEVKRILTEAGAIYL